MSKRLTWLVAGDPNQRTGGYIYDAQIVDALREQGHEIDVVGLAGRFPDADTEAAEQLADVLEAQQRGAHVVIDGLAMGALPEIVASHADRLDITALLHHPLGDEQGISEADRQRLHRSELLGLSSVARVIVTSRFTERRVAELADDYGLAVRTPISVVEPGVTRAALSPAAEPGEPIRLLCIATLTPRKGQDILVRALAGVNGDNWQCDCYGGARDAEFTNRVDQLIEESQLTERVTLHGECDAATLEAAYQRAHALVLPSWYEGYGMVVSEALAHGLPVITTTGGALWDTLPEGAGISVAPGDIQALQAALQDFCESAELRTQLRAGVASVWGDLNDWQAAGVAFAEALEHAPNGGAQGSHFDADWLTQRETVDCRARSQSLAHTAAQWLATRQAPPVIADLGCGRGSNMQFLAPHVSGNQHWMLFDHDDSLLREARQRAFKLHSADGQPISSETHCVSLANLPPEALSRAQLVTAAALLDLVSRRWIDVLATQCAKHQQALLVAMSVTGEWCFIDTQLAPIDSDEDRWMAGLFNAHQRRDKGFGDALGGEAHSMLVSALEAYDYRIEQVETPWLLAAGNRDQQSLMTSLIHGWAEAATEQAPTEAARIAEWRDARQQAIAAGEMGIWVGHCDLLALPAEEA